MTPLICLHVTLKQRELIKELIQKQDGYHHLFSDDQCTPESNLDDYERWPHLMVDKGLITGVSPMLFVIDEINENYPEYLIVPFDNFFNELHILIA